MKIALNGAFGRMGRMVQEAARDASDQIVALVERQDHPFVGKQLETPWGPLEVLGRPEGIPSEVDVGIDFSSPKGAIAFAKVLASRGVPVLSGTTGLSSEDHEALKEFARTAPILWTPNTSIGVFCLQEVSVLAKRLLGAGYVVEIVEAHHRHKLDAPSGTALSIARALGGHVEAGKARQGGERGEEEIWIHSIRGGEIVGEHTVIFIGDHDRLEFTHRAMSRKLFAEGALRLARLLVRRGPGLYTVRDLLSSQE